jgi:capsular polysaccharide biosynthesis protein
MTTENNGERGVAPALRLAHPRWGRPIAVAVLAVLGAVLATVAALVYTATTSKTYTAEALVVVLSDSGSTSDLGPITAAWVEIGGAPTVLTGAAATLHVEVQELKKALTVSQPGSTPLVSIAMVTADPQRSAAWANAVADQLLDQADRRPITGFQLNQLTSAVPAPAADPDQTSTILITAAVAGALGGGVLGRAIQRRRTTG